jgi:Fur family ferric uptake transcriptional regulator
MKTPKTPAPKSKTPECKLKASPEKTSARTAKTPTKPIVKVEPQPDHFDEALTQLKAYLERFNKKNTMERTLILRKLQQLTQPVDIPTLGQLMTDEHNRVSTATLYNTLQLFCDAGLVSRIDLTDGGSACYVRTVGLPPRVYIICRRCASIVAAHDPQLDEQLSSMVPKGFKVMQQALHLIGLCGRCQNTINRAEQRRRAKKEQSHNK